MAPRIVEAADRVRSQPFGLWTSDSEEVGTAKYWFYTQKLQEKTLLHPLKNLGATQGIRLRYATQFQVWAGSFNEGTQQQVD